MRLVWERLGAPTLDAAVITIAGTNGKGSSVAFAESILQAGGYRTGCYTSPHLQHYNERIRVDQVPVDDALLCAAFERVDRSATGSRSPISNSVPWRRCVYSAMPARCRGPRSGTGRAPGCRQPDRSPMWR